MRYAEQPDVQDVMARKSVHDVVALISKYIHLSLTPYFPLRGQVKSYEALV